MITSTVIADSINPNGDRITTIVSTIPKFILAEVNKHRIISNNAQSTRAVPLAKQIEYVKTDPFIPIFWGKNQPGMFAQDQVDDPDRCVELWLQARDRAVQTAEEFLALGLHKQTAGRLLEPFAWCSVVLTSTTWSNFLTLRKHVSAQPEIRAMAHSIKDCLNDSVPVQVEWGEWHLPFVPDADRRLSPGQGPEPGWSPRLTICSPLAASVARAARVSYGRVGVISTDEEEYDRYCRLLDGKHWSAFEHAAISGPGYGPNVKNFTGWVPFRAFHKNEHDASL